MRASVVALILSARKSVIAANYVHQKQEIKLLRAALEEIAAPMNDVAGQATHFSSLKRRSIARAAIAEIKAA